MNDEKFDKSVKNQLKQTIEIPKDIENILTNSINTSKPKTKSKFKIIFTKFIQAIISLLAICAISGGVYAAATGNSVLSLLGLGKAGETFETSSVNINKSIKNKYVELTLNRMNCDNTFLILEYNVKFTQLGLNNIELVKNGTDLDNNDIERNSVTEEYTSDTLELCGGIFVNGANTEDYTSYTDKISDGEYKLYHIILMNNNRKNLKIEVGAYYLQYNNINISFGDTYSFFLDLSLKDNTNSYVSKQSQYDNTNISINSIVDSSIATVGKGTIQITGLSDSNKNLTNITFKALDENGNKINVETHILKSIITTENDESIDMKKEANNANVKFANGTANIEVSLLFKNGINDSKSITLIPYRNSKALGEGINLDVSNLAESHITLNSIELDTNYSDLSRAYSMEIHDNEGIINPYYTPNAPKISLPDFEINGMKLGMSIDEVIENLQESYNKKNININCKQHLKYNDISPYYSDDYMELRFSQDSNGNTILQSINMFDTTGWDKYGMAEKDFISSYYSEEKFQPFNQSVYEYKVLYGKDNVILDFDGKAVTGEFAYIFANDDRDSFIRYYDNKMDLGMSIDQTTKVITSIGLEIFDTN